MTDRQSFAAWIEGYERAWRTPGTDGLRALFTEDATYRHGPYDEPVVGLAAIAADWEAEREGPDEPFTMTWEIVAVEGSMGVARLEVRYGAPVNEEFLDVWLVRFAGDGRCAEFEEWPYWPPVPR
jgi:ketosteroid isomerase-like protein